ncbi:MAG: biotin carboxylase N-terminal domain-containing protein [Pseudomonadota bacterium]
MTDITKILIANRGEIAVRIARTCRRLGIRTVAVFSDADRDALHVRVCDEAVHIGASAPAESYLKIEKIIDAAQQTGAEAVHPGYGFLSENAAFAEALDEAGIIFIGPTAETIRAMGSKSAAKDLMEAAGVPTTPGYQGADQSLQVFKSEAEKIGYPILLKATAGGGGKGMRIVEAEKDLKGALSSAKQEAKSAFGDDRFLVEKYIPKARHLEVQIFGDGKGEVVHLYERDCSVQRRHQKIIEEAPAPDLAPVVRDKLLAAGVAAGQAVNYRGAGTVEFLYDGAEGVYFMEMNTRLQVEHPVSECITGEDLVEWQIAVAAGGALPKPQSEITTYGHAFEARLYAEKPEADFAPSIGDLQHVALPNDLARIDTGIAAGQTISTFYDPMIAKIIVHGDTRGNALGRLRLALSETAITGVETNAAFLSALAEDQDFTEGRVSTRYIEEHYEALFSLAEIETVAACAYALYQMQTGAGPELGFRLNAPRQAHFWGQVHDQPQRFTVSQNGEELSLKRSAHADAADRRSGQSSEDLGEITFTGSIEADGRFAIALNGVRQTGCILPHLGCLRIFSNGRSLDIGAFDPRLGAGDGHDDAGSLVAPMPGVILAVYVKEGDAIERGQDLASMEAMKMEHTIIAPSSGTVSSVKYAVGDQVKDGDRLFDIDTAD